MDSQPVTNGLIGGQTSMAGGPQFPIQNHRHTGLDFPKVSFYDLAEVSFRQATIDPGNLADGAGTTISVPYPGAVLGDFVLVSAPYDLQDITVTGYVQSAATVEVRIQNESGSAVDLASGLWRITVIKKKL